MKKDSTPQHAATNTECRDYTSRPLTPRRRLLLEVLESRELLAADVLYVGDAGTDAIQKFDADTGVLIGTFLPGGTSLHGPRGMVFHDDKLFVVNQNVDPGDGSASLNGELLRFDGQTGVRSIRSSPRPIPMHRSHRADL